MTQQRQAAFTAVWRFGAVIVVAILVLGVLNALPQFLGGEPLDVVRYASVEEAEARLSARLYRPVAVPSAWASPPARVRLAVGRPDWVEFVFARQVPTGAADRRKAAGSEEADSGPLVMCQALGESPADVEVAPILLPHGELLQATDVAIGGRTARMRRLLLDDGRIVHELWWREGARRVMLRGQVAADSLPRIAQTIFGIGR